MDRQLDTARYTRAKVTHGIVHILTSIGVKVKFLLLRTDIIDDSQQMKSPIRCAHSKLLWVLLRIPV